MMINKTTYENMIKDYINQTIIYYKKSSKERGTIHEYNWDNDIHDDSILFEMVSLSSYIVGYATSVQKGKEARFQEVVDNLLPKSIYNSSIIVNWLTQENIKQYPNYFNYILLIENLRILTIHASSHYLREQEKTEVNT